MGKVVPIVLGTAAGLALGVLMAPKSGKETRADIKHKAQDIKARSTEKYEKVAGDVKQGAKKVKDLADDSVKNLKSNAQEARDELAKREGASR